MKPGQSGRNEGRKRVGHGNDSRNEVEEGQAGIDVRWDMKREMRALVR